MQSVTLVFSTGYFPANLPSTLPLTHCIRIYCTVYSFTQGRGGGRANHGVKRGGGGPQTDETPAAKSLQRSIFQITTFGIVFSFGIAFYQSNLSMPKNRGLIFHKHLTAYSLYHCASLPSSSFVRAVFICAFVSNFLLSTLHASKETIFSKVKINYRKKAMFSCCR